MEKEILEILKSIQLDIKGLKDEVKDLNCLLYTSRCV